MSPETRPSNPPSNPPSDVITARDKYLCTLLVDWYRRVNGGEDYGAPAESILRNLIRVADAKSSGETREGPAAAGAAFVATFGCEPKSVADCAWMNGWAAARTPTTDTPRPCVCGQPEKSGIVHRTDGPCYHDIDILGAE